MTSFTTLFYYYQSTFSFNVKIYFTDVEELRNELSAARQVIRARDAEQGALRRRAEHFRRDLLQAESLAVQQTNEVDLIRIQLKNETNNARKSINKAEGK